MFYRVRLDVIEEARKKRKLSLSALSRRADLGYTTVYNIFNGKTIDPGLQTLGAIARVLSLSLEQIVEEVPQGETEGQIWTPGLVKAI
jgi:transcriptional regulator with XRE-family HTH domain